MRLNACPFCGVVTDVPHEKPELCIAALHGEIARMRDMVRRVKGPQRPPAPTAVPRHDQDVPPARDRT